MCKKFVAMGAALALTLSLAACGKAGNETTVPSGTKEPSSTTQPSQSSKPVETTVPETTVPETTGEADEDFQELTLVENEDCTVKVTGINEKDLLGYTVLVYLENNSDDNLMFSVSDVSVNGFMIDPFWAATVSAGKKANENITFLTSDFEKNGIETVEEITFTLRVYDNDDLTAEDVVKETFTVKP